MTRPAASRSPAMRSSLPSRVGAVLFALVWCGLLVSYTVREWPVESSLLVLRALGIVVVAAFVYRTAAVQVAVAGDVLVVRNLWRTRRVDRAQVRRIWLGEPLAAPLPGGWLPGPRGEAVNVEAAQCSFTIDVTRDWLGIGKRHETLLALTADLEGWRRGEGGRDRPGSG